MERTDQELIQAIKQGDQDSANVLYERYYSMAVKVSLRILRSLDDALDIAQEVFMRVLVQKKIMSFRGEAQFSSWLYKITTNLSLSFLKRKQKMCESRHKNKKEYQYSHYRTSENADQLICLESLEKTKYIGQVLNALPSLYGKCLYLRYYEGHKYKEIAKKLKITRDRVGMQIMRSRSMLNKNQELKELYAS